MSLLDLIKSPQAMERAEWAAVLHTLTRARTELCKDGVTHTWLDGAIGIAQERSEGKGTYAPPDVGEAEPDWSNSVTDGGKLWKTPSRPMSERLQLADEAVANRDRIIANLRPHMVPPAVPADVKPAQIAATNKRSRVILMLEWAGSLLGLTGAFLLAIHAHFSPYGWIAFLLANLAMIGFAIGIRRYGLLVQQIGFTATSVLGIYHAGFVSFPIESFL